MLELKERPLEREEAYKLAERMADKELSNYMIREVLTDKGLSAYQANEIISEMRRNEALANQKRIPLDLDLGLILTILAIIALISYVFVSNSS
jgi:hypothetical protein